jgi:hypothetical protein
VKWYPLGYTNYSIFDLQESIIHGLRRYSTSLLLAISLSLAGQDTDATSLLLAISLSLAGQDTDAAETQPDLRNGVEQRIKLTQSYLASKTAELPGLENGAEDCRNRQFASAPAAAKGPGIAGAGKRPTVAGKP